MTTKTRTEQVLNEMNNERWAAMSPAGRVNCRLMYRWARRDGMNRLRAHVVVEACTLAGEGAGRQAVAS